jgi:hypothetical protein
MSMSPYRKATPSVPQASSQTPEPKGSSGQHNEAASDSPWTFELGHRYDSLSSMPDSHLAICWGPLVEPLDSEASSLPGRVILVSETLPLYRITITSCTARRWLSWLNRSQIIFRRENHSDVEVFLIYDKTDPTSLSLPLDTRLSTS